MEAVKAGAGEHDSAVSACWSSALVVQPVGLLWLWSLSRLPAFGDINHGLRGFTSQRMLYQITMGWAVAYQGSMLSILRLQGFLKVLRHRAESLSC